MSERLLTSPTSTARPEGLAARPPSAPASVIVKKEPGTAGAAAAKDVKPTRMELERGRDVQPVVLVPGTSKEADGVDGQE